MSSDVYLDFNLGSSGYHTTRQDTTRIGHLGLMAYFQYDLVSALKMLIDATNGVVTDWLPIAAQNVCAKYWADIKEDLSHDAEWFSAKYGYHKPFDNEDYPRPEDLFNLFQSRVGQTWCLRVD